MASDYLSRNNQMDKNSARCVFIEELERFSGKRMEEMDAEIETLASLGVDLEPFINAVVRATRRGIIVHSYDGDSVQTIMDRTLR